jgi:hypothetical protein
MALTTVPAGKRSAPTGRNAGVVPNGRHRPVPDATHLERAPFVWSRALELAGPAQREDLFRLALELLRSAHHDPATMRHALALGRSWTRQHPADASAASAVGLLERTITFLGVKPRDDEVGGVGQPG